MDTSGLILVDQDAGVSPNNETIISNDENLITDVISVNERSTMQVPSTPELDLSQHQTQSLRNTPLESNLEQMTVKRDTEVVNNEKIPRINELDKFKRRLIRAIARLMLVEKKPEAEIWQELKKETTCDCKLLWTRMRALTIKKLKRLIAAGDRNEYITKIAQLSVTDWLLFDLVLVHEEVDVIGQDTQKDSEKDPKILEDLFQLVVKYNIQYLCGNQLTIAWHDLTTEYNSRGRKCSPMLLQRRWYQMKKQIRYKFYNFWFEYRGSAKKLKQADKYKPTELEMEIVKVFMSIVTYPFQSWEHLIEERKVSLPSDFERLQLSKKKTTHTENEPDVQLIEPHVETIDLGLDSDEDSKGSNDSVHENEGLNTYIDNIDLNNEGRDNVSPNNVQNNDENDNATVIKTESIYDICDEDEVSALESIHIPLESNVNLAITELNKEINATDLDDTNVIHDKIQHSNERIGCIADINKEGNKMQEMTDNVHDENYVKEDDDEFVELDLIEQTNDTVHTQVVEQNDFIMPKITSITSNAQMPENDVDYETSDENLVEITTNKISQNIFFKTTPEKNTNEKVIDTESTNISEDKEEIVVERKPELNPNFFNEEVTNDLHLIDGIELEDDGIEYIDEEEHFKEPKIDIKVEMDEPTITDDDDTPKIDLKLLLDPVVYTKKLDHMDVFRFIDYIAVKDRRVIENAADESKPVDKKSVKMDDISQECKNSAEDDTLSDKASECSSENEQEVIKSTSWLLRKPRVATYNPIQLCKNPDFNTRLKRLTVGFFSSQRNRHLLQQCKPLTIDVHKSFESKLVNNSLRFKKSYFSEAKDTELIKTVEKSVLPSELPGQTLNCITQDSINSSPIPSTSTINHASKNEFANDVFTIERNKVINLPDLDQIRRKNEKLLIAEVTPLQASNITNKPPVAIVQENKVVEKDPQHLKDSERDIVSKDLNNTNTSITIVDTPELENEYHNNINKQKTNTTFRDVSNKKLSYNPRSKLYKALIKPPVKIRKVAVTWNPKYVPTAENDDVDDRLLARDTVERIISVCKGINIPLSKNNQHIFNKKKYKANKVALMKKAKLQKCSENIQTTNEKNTPEIFNKQQEKPVTIQSEIVDQNQSKLCTEANNTITEVRRECQTQKSYGKYKKVPKRQKVHYCCWAREKLELWDNKIKRMTSRHLCPQFKCRCCCNIEYCSELRRRRDKKISKVTSFLNLVSDDDSDHNTQNISNDQQQYQTGNKQLKLTCNKINIGVNTDFDKDFEESYAANINNLNVSNSVNVTNQPIISYVTSLNKESYNNATQTFAYKQIESGSQDSLHSNDKMNNKEKVEPSNLISTIPTLLQTGGKEDKLKKVRPKCKTKIHSGPGYIPILPAQQNILNTKTSELSNFNIANNLSIEKCSNNKVLVLNNRTKNKISQKPICLGKNKILLCSLKPLSKTSMIDVTHLVDNFKPHLTTNDGMNVHPSMLIPKGVHLVLLPNQELVLSIDPGIELDPTQITYLPAIINSVQQQLLTLGVINKLPITETSKVGDIIQLSDDETENSKANKSQLIATESEPILRDLEEDISINKIDKSNAYSVQHINDEPPSNELPTESLPVVESINQPVNNNAETTRTDEAIPDLAIDTASEKVEEKYTLSSNSDQVLDNPVDKTKKDDMKERNISKKTILSDLMEMSGISLEDTAITSNESPITQQPSLQPTMYSDKFNTAPNTCEEDISINPIFNNPFVQAALIKCPDLNVIYSFEDLKYAYENNGQFYKMDIETGIIVPINVCIKKQISRVKPSTKKISKSVIDLTEEDKVDDQTFSPESKLEEHNIDNIDISPFNVKPIKLFKAVHPSILRHNFKTLLKQKKSKDFIPNLRGKRVIKITRHKRKKNIEESYLNIQNTKKSKCAENEKKDIDSESDDEPLALKAKRIRKTSEDTSENIEKNENIIENSQEIEKMEQNRQEINFDGVVTPNVPMLAENQQEIFEASHQEPIIFQCNNDESSEEDCILGV